MDKHFPPPRGDCGHPMTHYAAALIGIFLFSCETQRAEVPKPPDSQQSSPPSTSGVQSPSSCEAWKAMDSEQRLNEFASCRRSGASR